MVSRRFLGPLGAVLLLALVPTVMHGYGTYVAEAPQVTAASLPTTLAGVPGVVQSRTGAWMTSTYAADSWAQRAYDVPGQGTITLFVARGFDLKKLYHHPELGVLRGRSFERVRRAFLNGTAVHPVHVLENVSPDSESAVYALVYEGRWVDNPYVLQFSSAATSLWTGRRPLTLVFAYGAVLADGRPSAAVTQLLQTAVRGLGPAPAGS